MPSFDIVSKVDMAEVDNAFQQAKKEVDQRYDFKGTDTLIERVQDEKANGLRVKSSTAQRLETAREVIVTKLAKRGISLRSVKYGPVELSGKTHAQLGEKDARLLAGAGLIRLVQNGDGSQRRHWKVRQGRIQEAGGGVRKRCFGGEVTGGY